MSDLITKEAYLALAADVYDRMRPVLDAARAAGISGIEGKIYDGENLRASLQVDSGAPVLFLWVLLEGGRPPKEKT